MTKIHSIALGLVASCTLSCALYAKHSNDSEVTIPKNKVLIKGEFLYWQADVDDAELATSERPQADNIHINKNTINLKGEWKPGFRLGLGYHFSNFDNWNLFADWTSMHSRSQNISQSVSNLNLLNTRGGFYRQGWSSFLGPIVSSVSGHWSIDLSVFDLGVSRNFNVSEKIGIRPYVGVRGAWVDLNYKANYTGLWTPETGSVFLSAPTAFNGKSDYSSGGLRIGSGLDWKFSKNWAFVGDVAASLLFGRFKVNETFNGATTEDGAALISIIEQYKSGMNAVRSSLEASLGVRWSTAFNDEKMHFSIFAGYELSKWFRLNELFQLVRTLDAEIDGDGNVVNFNATFNRNHLSNDIGYQGITLRAALTF